LAVTGPFGHKNEFAGFLLIPVSLALALGCYPASSKERIFYGLCFLLVVRALLFSQSRGAIAGWFVSLLCFGVVSAYTKEGRKRLPLLFLGALFSVTTILAAVVFFNKGASLSHYHDLIAPTKADNMTWRVQERWPNFFQKIAGNPWLGVGTDVEPSFGRDTNTPHNAYLAMAVKSGIPSLLAFLSFVVIALRRSVFVIRSSRDKWLRWPAAGILSAIVALSIHSLVDGILSNPLTQTFFWVLLAWSTVAAVNTRNENRAGGNARRTPCSAFMPVFARYSALQK